jgi:hypothetical protein
MEGIKDNKILEVAKAITRPEDFSPFPYILEKDLTRQYHVFLIAITNYMDNRGNTYFPIFVSIGIYLHEGSLLCI